MVTFKLQALFRFRESNWNQEQDNIASSETCHLIYYNNYKNIMIQFMMKKNKLQ
jgi:hypothetical protein